MGHRPRKTQYILVALGVDIAAIIAGFFLTYCFRFMTGIIPVRGGGAVPEFEEYVSALLVLVPVYLLFFRAYGLYKAERHIRRIEEIFIVIKAVTFSVLILTAATFFYREKSYSRIYLVILWALTIGTVSLGRYLLIQWEYFRKKRKKEITRVLIIGANPNARHIIQWAQNNPHYGQEVIGVLSKDAELIGKHVEDVSIIGSTEDCECMIEKQQPDRVVLVDPSFSRDRITELAIACEDAFIDFKVTADFYGLMTRSLDIENVSSVPLLGFRELPLDDPWNRILKRTLDMTVAFIGLTITLPLWATAMILIKMSDRGPVFYAQERVGRDHKVFKVLKFRTMKVDAEKETGPVWAKPNDSRRTRFGHWLRKYNVDELPQILNVLKGDMSLVGPRPERPHFVNQFRESIPRYMARHKIKSGITGWAQVNGFRGNTSIKERLKYDLYYMENWSLLLDIEIIFMTLFAYKNAY